MRSGEICTTTIFYSKTRFSSLHDIYKTCVWKFWTFEFFNWVSVKLILCSSNHLLEQVLRTGVDCLGTANLWRAQMLAILILYSLERICSELFGIRIVLSEFSSLFSQITFLLILNIILGFYFLFKIRFKYCVHSQFWEAILSQWCP